MNYRSCTAIKGQTLANFIAQFTYFDTIEVAGTTSNVEAMQEVEMKRDKMSTTKGEDNNTNMEQWTLYVDGASNENGSGACMMLISPYQGRRSIVHYTLGSMRRTTRLNMRRI